ncbi:MAG: response regulator [Syntrophales bacterium]|nr:response regulator [Syntrophales bacterium]
MVGLLVVDDEEGVRKSVKKVLEREGYTIFLAEDGRQAIKIVSENLLSIETVISDYRMPGIDGLETLIEVGKLNPEITRIMLTGYATMESAIESVNAGIDGFLTKPFSNVELRAKVREYILKKRLKQFVSEKVLLELQSRSERIELVRKEVSVLFCDIRGFTDLSEKLDTGELSERLNTDYFTPVDAVICGHDGMLDKHIGDGIMAIFGAPADCGNSAEKAVHCALSIVETMSHINKRLEQTSGYVIEVGIGISTGEVMAGIFGSCRKREYTVFGQPVNIAARLETIAKAHQVLICETTYRRLYESIIVEKKEKAHLKGIRSNLGVYEVLGKYASKTS